MKLKNIGSHLVSGTWLISILSLSLLAGVVHAQTALQDISFSSLPSSQFQIELKFNTAPPSPEVFMLEVPARLTMDLSNVSNELQERRYALNSKLADSVMILEAQGRTRVVVNMLESAPYETRIQDNSLYVVFGQPVSAQANRAVAVAAQTTSGGSDTFVPVANVGSDITKVDFKRADDNVGQIIIDLARDGLNANIRQSGSRLTLEFSNASVNRDQQARLDVSDFATQVKTVSMYNEDENVVVLVEVDGEFEFLAYQRDKQYIINVMSLAAAQSNNRGDAVMFSGEPISLSFQSIEVRTILQILAEFNNYNLVMGDNVTGTMALNLEQVPWDQAMDMVLRTRGLAKRLVGNVLYVAPANEIAEAERQELEANNQSSALAPLVTEYIEVNYATADDLMLLLGGGAEGASSGGILSNRGRVSVDRRTNTLIVQDVETVIEDVRSLLSRLDVPVRQVLIEARIVNASTRFSEALGIRWGGSHITDTGDPFILSGSLESTAQLANNLSDYNSAIATAVAGGATLDEARALNTLASPSIQQSLVVDLGAEAPSSSISIGFQGNKGLLQLELSALEASGNGEVIAQPKVTTQDQQNARIESGVQIPYQSQAGGTAGGTTTTFVTAALSLDVTPQITPDGRIIMLLDIHQDTAGASTSGPPPITTNSITTRVLVNNGDTIVLGGVFREEVNTAISKTPLLGDLPYIGSLFRQTANQQTKTELLIFITPSIIDEAL